MVIGSSLSISSQLEADFTLLPLRIVQNGDCSDNDQSKENQELTIICNQIQSFHKRLLELKSFTPSKETNLVFTQFVDFVIRTRIPDMELHHLMALPEMIAICRDTRRICAEAETVLESHWADYLLMKEDSQLTDFPYHDNYLKLIRMEYHLLFGQGAQPRHFMFIGSGPLPLSSLTLASQHLSKDSKGNDWSVFNIDMCPHANKLGSDFARKLFPHYMDNVTFLDCNATDIPSDLINKFDVIYLAALVGLDMRSKQEIVRSLVLHMTPGSRLLLRSVHGLRRLLYPDVDEIALLETVEGRLELEVVCHPKHSVINSVVIARRI